MLRTVTIGNIMEADNRIDKIKVVICNQTCMACPSQWEGVTDDHRMIYVRYRWGELTVSIGASGDIDRFAAVGGKCILSKQLGDELDGVLSFEELVEATRDIIEWPETNINKGNKHAS